MWALPISDTGERSARPRRIPRLAHAARGNSGLGSGGNRPARVGFQAAGYIGKFIFFLFSFEFVFQSHFKIDFKAKSNKTKTTPLNKTNATA
jgi:hypothetical protein